MPSDAQNQQSSAVEMLKLLHKKWPEAVVIVNAEIRRLEEQLEVQRLTLSRHHEIHYAAPAWGQECSICGPSSNPASEPETFRITPGQEKTLNRAAHNQESRGDA